MGIWVLDGILNVLAWGSIYSIKNQHLGAGGLPQHLGALVAFAEDLRSVPYDGSQLFVTLSSRDPTVTAEFLRHQLSCGTHNICAGRTLVNNNKKTKNKTKTPKTRNLKIDT